MMIGGIIDYYDKVKIKCITEQLSNKKYFEMIDEQINRYATRFAENIFLNITFLSTSRYQ